MALTVGTDTYISLTDADAYLAANYLSTDTKLIAWVALTDANCEVLLKKAAKTIDRQAFIGQKKVSTQTMAFPRAYYNWPYSYYTYNTVNLYFDQDWYVESAVTNDVKYAQCEIAITEASGVSDRQQLQREGVKSFSIGKLSENYGSGSANAIYSVEAREYLKPYLAGSVAIR